MTSPHFHSLAEMDGAAASAASDAGLATCSFLVPNPSAAPPTGISFIAVKLFAEAHWSFTYLLFAAHGDESAFVEAFRAIGMPAARLSRTARVVCVAQHFCVLLMWHCIAFVCLLALIKGARFACRRVCDHAPGWRRWRVRGRGRGRGPEDGYKTD